MKPLFIEYPRCSTCRKASAWLMQNKIDVEVRDIVLDRPKAQELSAWIAKSALPISRFFNTSGMRYRELGLKDRVQVAPMDELLSVLASDGMLVKRPILVSGDVVLVGFREQEWSGALLGK